MFVLCDVNTFMHIIFFCLSFKRKKEIEDCSDFVGWLAVVLTVKFLPTARKKKSKNVRLKVFCKLFLLIFLFSSWQRLIFFFYSCQNNNCCNFPQLKFFSLPRNLFFVRGGFFSLFVPFLQFAFFYYTTKLSFLGCFFCLIPFFFTLFFWFRSKQ